MTGADIIGALLLGDPAVLALVPASQIKAGRLPEGASLPSLLVRIVSSNDAQPLTRGATVRRRDRVSVTVRALSLRQQREALRLVRAACAGRTGEIGGARRVAVLTAGTGPDLDGPGNSFEQAQDFRVSFDAED